MMWVTFLWKGESGIPHLYYVRQAADALRMAWPTSMNGLDLEEFFRTRPRHSGHERGPLYVRPIGDFVGSPVLVEEMMRAIHIVYGLRVEKQARLDLLRIPENVRRTHASQGQLQLRCGWVLRRLTASKPEDASGQLALSSCDLYEEGRNYVLSDADEERQVSVMSVYRLGDPRHEAALFMRRSLGLVLQQAARVLALPSCPSPDCVLHPAHTVQALDVLPLTLCADCAPKVWWSCRVDPLIQLRALTEFAATLGLEEEAAAWRRQAEAVRGTLAN